MPRSTFTSFTLTYATTTDTSRPFATTTFLMALPATCACTPGVCKSDPLQLVVANVRRHRDTAADLAVDLDRDDDLVRSCDVSVEPGPCRGGEPSLVAEHLPHLLGGVWSKRRQHPDQASTASRTTQMVSFRSTCPACSTSSSVRRLGPPLMVFSLKA